MGKDEIGLNPGATVRPAVGFVGARRWIRGVFLVHGCMTSGSVGARLAAAGQARRPKQAQPGTLTVRALELWPGKFSRRLGRFAAGCGTGQSDGRPDLFQPCRPTAVGQQAVVTHLAEAPGQNVQGKAPGKLSGVQVHGPDAASPGVVTVAEGHLVTGAIQTQDAVHQADEGDVGGGSG